MLDNPSRSFSWHSRAAQAMDTGQLRGARQWGGLVLGVAQLPFEQVLVTILGFIPEVSSWRRKLLSIGHL